MVFLSLVFVLPFLGWVPSAIAVRRSLSVRWQLVLLATCLLYGILPLLVAWAGMSLAEHFACSVSGITYQCPTAPELSDLFSGMVLSHWLAIATFPSGALGALGMLVSLGLRISANGRNLTATFRRSRRHKVAAGLCAALAQKWRLPLLAVRTVTVVLFIVTSMLGLCLYLWGWIAFPPEPSVEST